MRSERRAGYRAWSVLCVLGLTAPASATPPSLTADLSCRPQAAPGRVLCELSLSVPPGTRLVWADALVVQAPEFAPPLRARVHQERFARTGERERKFSLAFVAARPGAGTATVLARGVVCPARDDASCRPATRRAQAELRVGL